MHKIDIRPAAEELKQLPHRQMFERNVLKAARNTANDRFTQQQQHSCEAGKPAGMCSKALHFLRAEYEAHRANDIHFKSNRYSDEELALKNAPPAR